MPGWGTRAGGEAGAVVDAARWREVGRRSRYQEAEAVGMIRARRSTPATGRDGEATCLRRSWTSPEVDTEVATPARMYDYYLGGKDNFPADREAAEKVLKNMPKVRAFARANRAFLGRAVRAVAAENVSQFLDVGIGLPGPGGTVASALAARPDAHVVGVDNDPIVLAHARARPVKAGGAGGDDRRRGSARADGDPGRSAGARGARLRAADRRDADRGAALRRVTTRTPTGSSRP